MTLPTLQEQPSALGSLVQGLGLGLQRSIPSIQEMIFNRRKQQATRDIESEKIPMASSKYLKEFHPSIYADPAKRRKIAELARKHYDSGLEPNESFQRAVEEFRGGRDRAGLELPKEGGEAGFGMLPEGEDKESFLQMLSKERGNIDPVTGKDISGHRSLFNKLVSPSSLKSKDILASVGLGTLEPLEDFLRGEELGNIDPVTGKDVTGHRGLSNYLPAPIRALVEKTETGKTPEELEQMEAIRAFSGFIPIEGAIFGLTKIGRQAKFLKNAEQLAAKAGIGTEEAAQRILQQAEKEGIDLAKVSQGDRQEAGKLYNLSNRVSREGKAAPSAGRVEKSAPEKRLYPTKERMRVREEQIKLYPQLEAEIAEDAAAKLARAEAREPKTPEGKAAREARVVKARQELPAAQQRYQQKAAEVRALESEVDRLVGADKERVGSLLNIAKSELRDAEFAFKQAIENLSGVSYRQGLKDMREAAQKKVLDISEKIAEGKAIELKKADYNPERIKRAKQLEKRKKIPAVRQDDFLTQTHQEYRNVYKKRLDDIQKEMSPRPKNLAEATQNLNLKKEADILKKLIDHADADIALHRHNLALRETHARKKIAEKLSQAKKAEAPKVEKVAREKIQEAVRNTESKAAEEVAEQAGVKKGDLKQAMDEIKAKTEQIEKDIKEGKPRNSVLRQIDAFAKEIKDKNWYNAFLRTPLGRDILFTMVGVAVEEAVGRKIPYSSFLTTLGGRAGVRPIRVALLFAYKLGKEQFLKQQYKGYLKREEDAKEVRFRKKHPKLAKEVQESLYD